MFSGFNLKSLASLSKAKESPSQPSESTPKSSSQNLDAKQSQALSTTSAFSTSTTTTLDSPKVLYCDLEGFWEPLSLLYFSLSNRNLVSHHKESSMEEVISHYCPACITRFMEDEVTLHRDLCPTCKECPICFSTLAVITVEAKAYFECGYCTWRSTFTANDAQSLHQSLAKVYQSKSHEEEFNFLLRTYEIVKKKTLPLIKGRPQGDTWKLSDIEKIVVQNSQPKVFSPLLESQLYRSIKSTTATDTSSIHQLDDVPSFEQRLRYADFQPARVDELLPVPVKLKVKRMVRCRKDVLEGALSIVLQPKTFPLEGDSSHKLQKGKWWVKNSCAAVEIPSIIIRKLPDVSALRKGMAGYLHLLIENPRESPITLRLCPGNKDDISLALKRPLPYSRQSWLSTTPKEYSLSLEAKEDELLKNSEAMADIQDVSLAPQETFSWIIVCVQNQARVCVPVMPDKDYIGQQCVYKLLLRMKIQDQDSSEKVAKEADDVLVQIVL